MPDRVRRNQSDRVAESASRLTDAFAGLLVERGYAGTTAADIGERAGYSRAMVRERFGSKQELLSHLQKEFEDRLFTEGLADAPARTGLQRSLAAFDALARFAREDPLLLRALFVVGMEAVTTEHVFHQTWVTTVALVRESFTRWVRQGRADGSITRRLEVDPAVDELLTAALGASYLWAQNGDADQYLGRIAYHRAAFERRCAITG